MSAGTGAAEAGNARFRTDIQALRGLAIVLVLAYHARLPGAPVAGYLGVDIFFVVSGYLITGIITRAIDSGTFSFKSFYFRRAKRLLPAAYVTFLVTAALAALLLTQDESHDFIAQLVGAVTFTGNMVLWRQTGYFAGAADLKPLLHVWSLAIEEQYYLLLPAALFLIARRYWAAVAWAGSMASLLLCLVYVRVDPSAAFYLLPTRAWELGLGSIAILVLNRRDFSPAIAALYFPALAALAIVPFFPTGARHPGPDALIVCAATLVVIMRNHPVVGHGRPAGVLAWFGDISYSLYLVHWPLLALAANAWVSPVPDTVRYCLAAAAVLLAKLLYETVERPIREWNLQPDLRTVTSVVAASAAVVGLGALLHRGPTGDQANYVEIRRANVGFSSACESGDSFDAKPECRNSNQPRMLVWGDSHAMHLIQGIRASTNQGLEQATKSACGPFLGLSYLAPTGSHNRNWAEGCIRFNQSVLEHLAATPTIEVVVLASAMNQYLDGDRVLVGSPTATRGAARKANERVGTQDIAAAALKDTVRAIRQLGKRAVFIGSMPMSGFDVGRCLEKLELGRIVLGGDTKSCDLIEANYLRKRKVVLDAIERISREADLPVIRLDQFLCREGLCAARLNGTILYRDAAHLTHDGSRRLGEDMSLGNRIWATAK